MGKSFIGGGVGGIDWHRLRAVCYFIRENLDKSPDYSLLVDWVNNEVNINGVGRVRAEQEGTWINHNFNDLFSQN